MLEFGYLYYHKFQQAQLHNFSNKHNVFLSHQTISTFLMPVFSANYMFHDINESKFSTFIFFKVSNIAHIFCCHFPVHMFHTRYKNINLTELD